MNPSQAQEVKEKKLKTLQDKHGIDVTCPFNISGISQIIANKNKNKSSEEKSRINDKKVQTSITNYGFTSAMASTEVQQLRINRSLEKYGCEFPGQKNISKEIFNLIKNKEWLEQQGKYLSSNEIARNLGVYPRIIKRYAKRHNINLKCKSSYERAMKNLLIDWNINFADNTRKILPSKLELDFYLPDHNLAIEICGLYWHSEKYKKLSYHKNKLLECNKLGIRLITIFEDEWVFRKTACINYLKNIIGNNTQQKIFARKCTIEEVSFSEVRDILNDNHIQGAPPNAKITLALKYDGKIVSVMCFSHQRGKMNKTDLWDLSRFCNNDCKVIGAAGKLFSYFIKTYNPDKVISFADARWSQGDVYYKIGFTMEEFIGPSYWYVNGQERYHKAGFSKSKLQSKGIDITSKTEREIMKEQGFLRIYDCGKYRFVWTKS